MKLDFNIGPPQSEIEVMPGVFGVFVPEEYSSSLT